MTVGPLVRVIIHVADMPASLQFYSELLGLEVAYEMGADWACLKTGQAQLCLMRAKDASKLPLRGQGEDTLCFVVPSVQLARDALLAKGLAVGAVESVGENAWVAKLTDPDGRMVLIENPEEGN